MQLKYNGKIYKIKKQLPILKVIVNKNPIPAKKQIGCRRAEMINWNSSYWEL